MKPRILFLDHVGVLGGGELWLLDLAIHYRDTSTVLLLEDGPFRQRLEEAGVRVHLLDIPSSVRTVTREQGGLRSLQSLPGVLSLAWQVARIARSFDLLYANSQKSFLIGALAAKLAFRPILWHLHDLMTDEHFSAANRTVSLFFGKHFARRVIANSQATAQSFIDSGGDPARVQVIYNGFDPAPLQAVDPARVTALRRELGLEGRFVAGVFSRLTWWKGQHVMVEALAQLPDVHVLFVGKPLFQEEDRYQAELLEQVVQRGVQDRVHFLGFRRDIPELLHVVDAVVHTSIAAEPFGRVVVEGMLAGRPVVATRAGGVLEIIDDGRTGLLVPPGDAAALAQVLARIQAQPQAFQEMAAAGQADAQTRFALSSVLQAVEAQVAAVMSH
jgi:glycosyltransferase involved in cell wall biosynthesis